MGQDTQQDLKDPLNMDSLGRCPSTRAAPEGSAHQRGRKGAPLGAISLMPALPSLAGCSAGSSRAK